MKNFIHNVEAIGGGDFPEDVVGDMRKCLDLSWSPDSKRQVFHLFDAPCHGRKYHNETCDSYPDVSPEGLVLEDLVSEFKSKQIQFTAIKLDDSCEKMIGIMKKAYSGMQVTDLSKATETKSAAEVTQMFVDSASYILRATVAGKSRTRSDKRKAVSGGKPLWNAKQLAVG